MRKRGTALRLASATADLAAPAGTALEQTPPAASPPLPAFTPVPRKYRHDGWTPERQKAFIEALADTGCVSRAAGMVNMAQTNCYQLRRSPGAEEFRRAWDAALDFGLKRLKDLAFERAVEGELIPVFAAGKLMGFRRKRNDALLMFVLRHYGQDAHGKRTTINYFSSRASVGAVRSEEPAPCPSRLREGSEAVAEASTTTVRTVIRGDGAAASPGKAPGKAEDALNAFEGVTLDPEAQAAILAALEGCAERARAAGKAIGEERADYEETDPDEHFVSLPHKGTPYRGELLPPGRAEGFELVEGGEVPWTWLGAEEPEPDMICGERDREEPMPHRNKSATKR